MDAEEHQSAAERLLVEAAETRRLDRSIALVQRAQVHATLALSLRPAQPQGPSWRTVNVGITDMPDWAEELIAAAAAGKWVD